MSNDNPLGVPAHRHRNPDGTFARTYRPAPPPTPVDGDSGRRGKAQIMATALHDAGVNTTVSASDNGLLIRVHDRHTPRLLELLATPPVGEERRPDGDRMATLLSRFAWLADSARSEGFQEAAAAYTVCCDELSDALTPAPSSSPVGDRPWMEPSAVVDALEAMSARLTNITGTQAAQLLVAADYVRLHIGAAADRGEPTDG